MEFRFTFADDSDDYEERGGRISAATIFPLQKAFMRAMKIPVHANTVQKSFADEKLLASIEMRSATSRCNEQQLDADIVVDAGDVGDGGGYVIGGVSGAGANVGGGGVGHSVLMGGVF